jgi:hypothetical protein
MMMMMMMMIVVVVVVVVVVVAVRHFSIGALPQQLCWLEGADEN